MGIAFDFKLDDSGDLTISDGDFAVTTTRSEMCRQSLYIILNTWQGEWFLDSTFGVPYMQQIIGVARKKTIIDKVLLEYIQSSDYVDTLISYSSTEDKTQRYYSATFTVQVDEDTVTSLVDTRPSQEFIYPTPNPDFTITCSEYDIAPYAAELYYYENREGLPPDTFDTWWNTWGGVPAT